MPKLDVPKVRLDQRLTIREKLFFVVAMVGLLILFVNIFWTPQSEEIRERKNKMRELDQQAQALETLIESTKQHIRIERSAPREEVKLDEKTRKILERKVVDPLAEIHQTVVLLSSRRMARSVKVDDVEIGETVDQDTYTMIPISIHLRGRYGAIQSYISSLRNINRPLVLKQFRLSREGDAVGTIDVMADLELFITKR